MGQMLRNKKKLIPKLEYRDKSVSLNDLGSSN